MTLDLSLLPDGGVAWLDASGDHADIVLSTRVRLARNVEGYAFTPRARGRGAAARACRRSARRRSTCRPLQGGVLLRVDELPDRGPQLLHERHLGLEELAGLDGPQGVRTGAAVLSAARPA
jgi:protein arginine kinase